MDLTDKDILDIHDNAQEAGHPDPVGLLARSEVITNLNHNFANTKRFGVTGVLQEEVERLNIESSSDVVSNILAAIKIDHDNYKSFKNVGDMHVAFFGGGQAVSSKKDRPKKFMRNLQKSKAKWHKKIASLKKKKEIPNESVLATASSIEAPQVIQPSEPLKGKSISEGGDASKIAKLKNVTKTSQEKTLPKKRVSTERKDLRNFIRAVITNG